MSDNHTPLFSRLCKTAEANAIRFHMPGHKGKPVFPDGVLPESIDYTELPATGNLYENSSPFCELNELFSRDYGAAKSFVLVGGATQGICAMIACAYSGRKDKTIVCERSAHRSVYSAMALNRLEPVYLYPSVPGTAPFSDTASDFDERALRSILESTHAPAVLITSPNYYGVIRDIRKLAHITHSHGALLLVDEAHGAHLPYLENRCSAISQGADMSVCSLHKTMRALGGAALLNSSDAFDSETIRFFLGVRRLNPRISYLRRRIWQGRISIPNGESSAIRCTARRKSGKRSISARLLPRSGANTQLMSRDMTRCA